MLEAAILAGGLGTRLRSEIGENQKVATEVAGQPFVTHLLERLSRQGVRRVVMCVGYQADKVQALLGDRFGCVDLAWSVEPAPLGTGGALALARALLRDEAATLVLNGDSYCDVDLEALVAAHNRHHARATLVAVRVPDASRFGTVELDSEGWVQRFHEKRADTAASLVNAGVYCLSPQLLRALPPTVPCSLEREVFAELLDRQLWAYEGGGAFIDIGTPETLRQATAFVQARARAGTDVLGRDRLVLIDRDGTVNREVHHLSSIDQLELLPGAAHALRRLRAAGFKLAIVTNQSVVGRGRISALELDAIHARLRAMLHAHAADVDAIYHCPHTPDAGCDCRKPRSGLAERAARDLGCELRDSFVIGDHKSDVAMGRAVGATTIHVRTGHGQRLAAEAAAYADYQAEDLWCAALIVERLARTDPSNDHNHSRETTW